MNNVDPAEINKFDSIAHRWWDLNGEFKALHDINPLRLDIIDREHSIDGTRIADVGCGGGILAEAMAKMGGDVTGLDMAGDALEVARLHALDQEVDLVYVQDTVENFAEQNPAQFDLVTCMEMLEHVPEPASVVNALSQLVRPGGTVIMSTLNRNLKSYLGAIVAAEHILKLIPKGTHQHSRFIKPSELARWARAADLELTNLCGLEYNPITKIYRHSDNTDINYFAVFKKAAA